MYMLDKIKVGLSCSFQSFFSLAFPIYLRPRVLQVH